MDHIPIRLRLRALEQVRDRLQVEVARQELICDELDERLVDAISRRDALFALYAQERFIDTGHWLEVSELFPEERVPQFPYEILVLGRTGEFVAAWGLLAGMRNRLAGVTTAITQLLATANLEA